jgi:hypothetical protein
MLEYQLKCLFSSGKLKPLTNEQAIYRNHLRFDRII